MLHQIPHWSEFFVNNFIETGIMADQALCGKLLKNFKLDEKFMAISTYKI